MNVKLNLHPFRIGLLVSVSPSGAAEHHVAPFPREQSVVKPNLTLTVRDKTQAQTASIFHWTL